MSRLINLIVLLRKLYKPLLTKDIIGNMNWIHSRWATEILLIAQQVKLRLSFYFLELLWRYYQLFQVLKMVQDKMMQLNVTAHLKKKWKLMLMRNEEQNQLS